MSSSWQKVAKKKHQFESRSGSRLYSDALSEVLGSGVVGTLPTTLVHRMALQHQKGISPELCATWLSRGKKGAISEHFLLIFLCLEQKRAGKKPALNPGTRVSLVKVLAKASLEHQSETSVCSCSVFADRNLSSTELESGNAIGAFLQTPAPALDKISGPMGA